MDASDSNAPIVTIADGSETPTVQVHGVPAQDLFRRALDTTQNRSLPWTVPGVGEVGAWLPQYRIDCLLGQGGMGAVYKGEHVPLKRPVAIKLLPAELAADTQFHVRFQREARILASLQHPGIVTVYDFGQTPAGHPYFVMEFVDGTDLARLVHGERTPSAQTLELVGQICEALQYAHSHGVVHRDIKPANVLISRDGKAKLADFGIALQATEGGTQLTRSNMVMGTPHYMAPEQWHGVADHRADIFAVGGILYEMLTGECPHGAFDLPSHRTDVDARLDQVILKALQQQPERRYQAASELKADIDVIRAKPQRPATPPDRARRNDFVWPSIVAFALLAAVVVWWWFHRPGEWVVQTEPKGALVTFGDHTYLAPTTLPGLRPGTYQAHVTHDGYEPRTVDFQLAAGQRVESGLVTLERSTGSIILFSYPMGVAYEVTSVTEEGGRFTGETPEMIRLPVGRYAVTMRHEGEIKTTDVEIVRNAEATQSFTFEKPVPPAPAAVIVSTPPPSSSLETGRVGSILTITLPGGQPLTLCYCPAGSFTMGSPVSEEGHGEDENQVNVRISKGFWMAQTECTQGQWESVMGTNPSYFTGSKDLPVEQVSWNDAQAFISLLNKSLSLPVGWKLALPTEAQWEYACRAGTKTVFSFGDTLTSAQANFDGNNPYGTTQKGPHLRTTSKVGSYAANAWGLYDMHGNVYEWCQDARDGSSKLPGGIDPVGSSGPIRVNRGGSLVYGATYCRSASRSRDGPGVSYALGFRLAAIHLGR